MRNIFGDILVSDQAQYYLWVLDNEKVTVPIAAAHINKFHTCIYRHSHLKKKGVKGDDGCVHYLSPLVSFFLPLLFFQEGSWKRGDLTFIESPGGKLIPPFLVLPLC